MPRTRLLSAALAALLLIVPAGGVLAQTPPPIERTPDMEEHAAELAALFPETLGGVSLLDNLEIDVGQELIGELDPSDPDDARDIEQLHELAEAAGATLDDTAAATSYAQLTEDASAFIIAYQIRGADIQQTLPLFVAAFEEDIPDAVIDEGQVGDVDVTLLSSGEDPEGGTSVILARGDVIWMLSVSPEFLEEAIESIPES